MKSSQITLIVLGFFLLVSMATNPSIEDHRQAVVEKMKEKMAESSNSDSKNEWQKAGEAIGMAIGGGIVEKAVSRDNYLIFSLTKISFGDIKKNIGFGILGKVWITETDFNEKENTSSGDRIINTEYANVQIVNQQWMEKNLDISSYRNGDIIPQVTDESEWASLTTGAWCYYNNDPKNGAIYGRLYNWYAVNDPRGLAPSGWHIPTDAEWTILSDNLGGESVAGGKMKTTGTTLWNSPNQSATNESGFAGLPGGIRNGNGRFNDVGYSGHWWSASQGNASGAWYRFLYNFSGDLGRSYYDEKNGFSVRCLRD